HSIAVTADGRTAVTSSRKDSIVWDLAARKPRTKLIGHTGEISALALTADNQTVMTGGLDERVKLWDIATGAERLTLVGAPGAGMVVSVTASANGRMVAAGGPGTVSLWQLSQSASSFDASLVKAKPKKAEPELWGKEGRAIHGQAEALTMQGPKGVAELANKVREGSIEWKIEALWALQSLGPEAEPALDALVKELSSKESKVRPLALETLAAIGPRAK